MKRTFTVTIDRCGGDNGLVIDESDIIESIHLLLKLLRDSGAPQKVIAAGGQLQQNLPQGRTFQLLRLRIDASLKLVPEISGNRLMAAVRLARLDADGKLHAARASRKYAGQP